jgi:5'-nucleotidase
VTLDGRDLVFGVDLDGVCGDYTSAFRRVVATDRGIDPDDLGDQLSWEFTEWGVGVEQFDELHRSAVLEHRIFRTMEPMAGASEVLWRLSDAGIWIRIITHRLCVNWGHAVAVADTVEWLDRNALPYRDICFLGRKPEVEADVYLDDGPHNIEALRDQGNDVIVFDQPYNRHLDGPRAADWSEVEELLTSLLVDQGVALQPRLPGVDDPAARLEARLRPGPRPN